MTKENEEERGAPAAAEKLADDFRRAPVVDVHGEPSAGAAMGRPAVVASAERSDFNMLQKIAGRHGFVFERRVREEEDAGVPLYLFVMGR